MSDYTKKFGLGIASRLLQAVSRGVTNFIQDVIRDANRIPDAPNPITQSVPQAIGVSRRVSMIQAVQADFRRRVSTFAGQLANGQIGVVEWRARMAQEIRTLHFNSRVIGAGGFGNLTPNDIAQIEARVREQLAYLERWTNQLDPNSLPSQGYMETRGQMYTGASNSTFHEAKHASMGIPIMPFYPGIDTECHGNCRCSWIEVERTDIDGSGNWDMYYRAIHDEAICGVCNARSHVANPLEVRNGKFTMPNRRDLWA